MKQNARQSRNNEKNKSARLVPWKQRAAILSLSLAMAMPIASHAAVATEADGLAQTSGQATVSSIPFGASAAMADTSLTLADMLTYALQDEYAAKAEYAAIQDAYGTVRPYSNIERSEDTHITLLKPLFTAYEISLPANDAAAHVVLPTSLAQSYAIGVDAEIRNIAMYEAFLSRDLPEDVRTVFERLMSASESHLAAFENAAGRSGAGTGATSANIGRSGGMGNAGTGRGFGSR